VAEEAAQEDIRPGRRERPARAETFAEVQDRLSRLERWNVAFIRKTFEVRWLNDLLRWVQAHVGAGWVDFCTRNIRHVHGLDALSDLVRSQESVVVVSNHRSFFDMYVINMLLYRAGFQQRLLFPVRSNFFYDHPLGFFVNGIMSWFSMYPPIFRDRKRAALNHVALAELAADLCHAGRSVGIHPEGTRKKDDDPYTFLPAQPGVGRIVHQARIRVLPVFINGLGNDLKRQVMGNFDRSGTPIIVVFGEPAAFEDLWAEPAGPKVYKAIAERSMGLVGALGEAERGLRADVLSRRG
jgi:1-acyl-sn-glycerol-3-phosphate acyltransferase